jgi:C-terminal processing protease CtpA/Prc
MEKTMHAFKPLITGAVLTLGVVFPALAQDVRPQDKLLSPDQVSADIKLAQDAFSRIHPGYTRYTNEQALNASWDAINMKAVAQNGLTLGAFYIEVQDILADIRCDHTKAELPKALAKDRNVTPVYLPVIWRVVDGRGFVENPGASDLTFGDEILSIDGRPLAELMDEVRPLIPADGDTGFVRDIQMGASLEFMGGAIDHFGALMWDIKPQAQLGVKTVTGETKTLTLDRIIHKDWKTLLQDGKISTDFPDSISFKRIGDQAAYLRIDSFVNYRNPVKPDKLYDPIFSALKKEGRDTLILDLRENGGGSTDAKARLFAHLIDHKARLVKDTRVKTLDHSGLEKHITTWEKRLLNPNKLGFKKNEDGSYSLRKMFAEDTKMIKPDNTAFTGKLYVLTSQSNGSASAALLAKLQDMGRATLIGEETGGSAEGTTAGVLFYVKLSESDIRLRVPVMQDFNDVATFDAGKGVTPDILAPMTVDAFIQKQDPAYEAALALISAH